MQAIIDQLPNKTKAHALVELGFQVIPVSKDPHGKNMFNFKWSEIIIRDHTLVDSYWYGTLDRDVAVLHDEYGAIDVDVKNGKDGFATIAAQGLELPYTPVSYETPNSGKHFIYRFPKGTTKSSPIYLGKTRIEGVDRQVGNGLAVWYGDAPSAEMLAMVPNAPEWALGVLSDDPMAPALRKVLDALIPGHIDHQSMLNAQYAIASEGAKGAVGYQEAMIDLRDLYLAGRYNIPEHQKEWQDALVGLQAKMPEIEQKARESGKDAAANPEKDFETRVSDKMVDLDVMETAKKRRMEALYNGTTAWDWDDLENVHVEYVLQDLLYRGSLNGFVGRSQIGKTFVMVSMLGAMCLGRDWFGLKTQQQKIMFVAGEGTGGIAGRFRDWARAEGVDWEEVKKNIKIVTDVDLYFDLSVEQLQGVANRFEPDLIVYDTLSATATIENENDAAAMAQLLANAKRVYPNSMTLFVHHPSNATKTMPNPQPRGSSVFYSNADNIMTLTVDSKFKPNVEIPPYSSGKNVHFLNLSTDFEDHGGKSKEGMPVTIKGLYLKEFETGHIVLAQTTGSRQHSHNSLIDACISYLQEQGRKFTVTAFHNAAIELELKDGDDPLGGWKSSKAARSIVESALERGYIVEIDPGSGPSAASYARPKLPQYDF